MSEMDMVNIFKDKLNEAGISFSCEVWVSAARADLVIENKGIAIEAKLKDINKAIYQSIIYQKRYKNTFILLPIEKKELVKKYQENLKRLNIKWMFIDKSTNELSFGHGSWKKMLFN